MWPTLPRTRRLLAAPVRDGDRARGRSPQLRVVALAECGTHAMFAAAVGPYTNGEPTLARQLAGAAGPGMLVLADRGFTAHPLFSAFAASGTALCWRAKGNASLPVLDRLADGSYISELVGFPDRHARAHGVPVRVVEYALDDPGRPQAEDNRYRLVTTLASPEEAPAAELGRPVRRTLGVRVGPRRAEGPPARPPGGAEVQDARGGPPRGMGVPVRPLRHPGIDGQRSR
jgi:hypothetical protein